MRLTGKTALITGGGTGIGQGIARALADEGCRVAICGRREEKLVETAKAFKGDPGIIYHTVDVADRASVADLVSWANQELGQIDILVNNAGVNVAKRTMADLSPEDWDKLMAINATGVYNLMHAVLPQMRERKDGLIVNISSIAGKRSSMLGGVAYCASKFAATALGGTVALEDNKHGIRVTSVFPGEVATPILENRPVPVSDEHRARILQPEDLGDAVLMICCLPPRAHIPELIIKPTSQDYA